MAQRGNQPAPAPAPLRAWATPEKFSGDMRDGDWHTWWEHFQTVSQVNNWTPVQQVAYLGLYLSGNAQSYYYSLPQATRQGPLAGLEQVLERRFGAAQNVDVFRAELHARKQYNGEPLSSFCEEIRKLSRRSYPTLDPQVQDVLGKDQFLNGLDSRELRIQVRTAAPATLDEALQHSLRIYAVLEAENKPTQTPAIAVQAINSAANTQPNTTTLLDRLSRLEATMEKLALLVEAGTSSQPTQRHSRPDNRCWQCGSKDHYRSTCPQLGRQHHRRQGN